MADDASVNLLARWRTGDQQAASELFQRYAEGLIALAHRRLSQKLAQRVAPEDVVQSVYCSFFVGARDGRYVLERSGDLWRLLVGITMHKLQHQVRRHTADKRSVAAEQPIDADDSLNGVPAQALARGPSPEEALALADLVEEVMRGLEPLQRRMVEMKLQAYSLEEIAADTNRSRSTVLRVLERVKEKLAQVYGHGPE